MKPCLLKVYRHSGTRRLCAIQCIDEKYDRVYLKLGPTDACFTFKQFEQFFSEVPAEKPKRKAVPSNKEIRKDGWDFLPVRRRGG